jgi:uncharacterized protein YndB with AHSA1/START domain
MADNSAQGRGGENELVIMRVFDAPREIVFDAFINPEHLAKWWGPTGCTVAMCETDPRVGGKWRLAMRSPRALPKFAIRYPSEGESDERWIIEKQSGEYIEVARPERLVFTYAFEGGGGRLVNQTIVTIELFEEANGRTRLWLRQAVFESVTARDDHVIGWNEAMDHLAGHLAGLG